MKVLITSGGTKIPIDSVRSITNMSNGTFGSQIADEFWKNRNEKDEVFFLKAKNSKIPVLNSKDCKFYEHEKAKFKDAWEDIHIVYKHKQYFCSNSNSNFYEYEYETFNDYQEKLFTILEDNQPDIVILAAAVSDYEVENVIDGKIRTSDELTIKLKPLPKLINKIKKVCPNSILCGFKLLVGSTTTELIDAAKKSIQNNRCDLVVANDLSTIRSDDHSLFIIEKDFIGEYYRSDERLSSVVYNFCLNHFLRK